MRLPWPRRDGDPAGDDDDATQRSTAPAPVPSPRSEERLAERVHREVEDLRAELADDLLLSLILIGEDEVEEAVGVLDDGSERLRRFQDRIEDAVADAAVERDAEAVLAAAETPRGGSAIEAPGGERSRAFRIRALASAAAAVLAAVVALVSVGPSEDPSLVAARASSAPPASAAPSLGGPGTGASATGPTPADAVSSATTTPGDRLEALRMIGDQGGILARLGAEPRRTVVAALFGVDRLVDQVVADVRRVLPSETVEAVTGTLSEGEPPVEEPSTETTAPEPEPSTEETPSEEPPGTTDGSTSEEPTEEPTTSEPDDEPSEEETSDDGTSDEESGDGSPDPLLEGASGDDGDPDGGSGIL